jgi:ribosomal protein L7/L12
MTEIRAEIISEALRNQASELYGTWSEVGITHMLDNLKADLIEKTRVDIKAEAVKVLNEIGTNRKIEAIKQMRTRCGLGLKEAKEAVEAALPTVLTAQLERLVQDLADANARVPFKHVVWPDTDKVDVKRP